MKNANQIRHLLTEVLDAFPKANYIEDCKSMRLLEEALALLPCETCGGSEIKPPEEGCGYCLAVDGSCWADCPCPDCQPKPKQEESSPSTMWEHLH